MTESWSTTSALNAFLEELIAGMSFTPQWTFYPSLMWSSGTIVDKPDGSREHLPPRYEVGLYRRDDALDLLSIPSDKFGLIYFLPDPVDLASSRRRIDFDGKNIIVR